MNVYKNGGTVFGWLVDITSTAGLITWDIILITYVRFYQGLAYHGIDRDTLPYKAPFQPYASFFGILFINLIILLNGFHVFLSHSWNIDSFITAYIALPIFLALCLFWKIFKHPTFVRVADMDFATGRRELNRSKFLHHHYQVDHKFLTTFAQWRKKNQPSTRNQKVLLPSYGIGSVSTVVTPFKLQDVCS